MKEFKILQNEIDLEKRKRVIIAIPIILVATIAGLYVGLSRTGYSSNMYIIFPIAILISFFAIFIGICRGNKINNDSISSFKIELMDDSINKYQKNVPEIEIIKAEVISITEVKNKGITIKTENENKYIQIPATVEGYADLKESLSKWMEIKIIEQSTSQLIQVATALEVVVGFSVIMLCKSIYIVIPVGIVLLLILIWSQYKILSNPHIDSRIKKNSLATLLPILLILLKVLSFL